MGSIKVLNKYILFIIIILAGLVPAGAHHNEQPDQDIFADVPFRVEGDHDAIPIMVEIKDAGSGGILGKVFGAIGGSILLGPCGYVWGASAAGCDYDLNRIEIWWDKNKDTGCCCYGFSPDYCPPNTAGPVGSDLSCDFGSCNNDDDDILIKVKSYRSGGDNLVIEDDHYNMFEEGDWYDMIYVKKEGYGAGGHSNTYYNLSGETHLVVVFVEDDSFDDCGDDDSYSIISLNVDDQNLPEIKGEKYYGGDTHWHSSYTDLTYFFHQVSNEFGNPVQGMAASGIGVGLDWSTVTDHSQEMTSEMWDSLGKEVDTFSSDKFKVIRAEEVSCHYEDIPPGPNHLFGIGDMNFRHYLAYNITEFIPGYESPLNEFGAIAHGFGSCFVIGETPGGASTYECSNAIDLVNGQDGFGYVAHPGINDFLRNPWPSAYLSLDFKGYELWNAGNNPDSHWMDIWEDQLKSNEIKWISGGSDAHGEFSAAYGKTPYGHISTWCHMCGLSEKNILGALKNGSCYMRNTYGPALHFDINGQKIGDQVEIQRSKKAILNIEYDKRFTPGTPFYIDIYKGESGRESKYTTISVPASSQNGSEQVEVPLSTQCTGTWCYFRVEMTPQSGVSGVQPAAFTNPIWVMPKDTACQKPFTGMKIYSDTRLCQGTYNLEPCIQEEGGKPAAITIKNDDVTLDCNGADIIGSGLGIGVYNPGYDNVTIKNCNLSYYQYGIELEVDPTEDKDTYYGDNLLFNNHIRKAGDLKGAEVFTQISSAGVVLRNNSPTGLHPNIIRENTIEDSTDSSIRLEVSGHVSIIDNTLYNNGFAGVDVVGASSFTQIINNTIQNNDQGVYVHDCPACRLGTVIRNNLIQGNNHMGVLINDPLSNHIVENTISSNRFGVVLTNSNNNWIRNNHIDGNKQHGVQVESGSVNTITNNSIWNNRNGITLQDSNNIVTGNDLRYNKQFSLWTTSCDNYVDDTNYGDALCSGSACYEPLGADSSEIIPILYEHNTSAYISGGGYDNLGWYSSIILCNAKNSMIDNVTIVSGIDNKLNDGILLINSDDIKVYNSQSSNNRYGVLLQQTTNSELKNNTLQNNAFDGIRINGANNEADYNFACFNRIYDIGIPFEGPGSNWGYENTCYETNGWQDWLCTRGSWPSCSAWTLVDDCEFECEFDIQEPLDTLLVTDNTRLPCDQVYNMDDPDRDGVLQIASDNIILDCCNSTLTGDGSGLGIYNPGYDNVVIRNCRLEDYARGIILDTDSDNNMLVNNYAKDNDYGIEIASLSDPELIQNAVCNNSVYDIKSESTGYGANNVCDSADGWSDVNKNDNCTLRCNPLPPPPPRECTCNSCDDCEQKLNSTKCDIVYLTEDIFMQQDTCINDPDGFTDKIFDCERHVIQGQGEDVGIYLKDGIESNAIRNCVIADFAAGIYLEAQDSYIINNEISENFIISNGEGIVIKSTYEPPGDPPVALDNRILSNIISLNENNGIRMYANEPAGTYARNIIQGNRINYNQEGINVQGFPGTIVEQNSVIVNSNTGISIDSAPGIDVLDNVFAKNSYGVQMDLDYANELSYNTLCKNDISDIDLLGGSVSDRGEGNTCTDPDGWNDFGTSGCTNECPVDFICSCSNCIDCSIKLQDPMCDSVVMDADIEQEGTCIQTLSNPDCYQYFGEQKPYSFCVNHPRNFNNKLFDCDGHTIYGSFSNNVSGHGITMYGSDGNEIRNCNVKNFERGLYMTNSHGNSIHDNRLNDNLYGLFVHSSSGNSINNNDLTMNYYQSLAVSEECGNDITSNIGGTGHPVLYVHDVNDIVIEDNRYAEIMLCNAHGATIDNVTVENGDLWSDGIFLIDSNDARVLNSSIYNNLRGINLLNSDATQIFNNIIGNNVHGVYVEFSNWTGIFHNSIHHNFGDGIDIWNSYESDVNGNEIFGNSWGIYLEYADMNSIINNVLDTNIIGIDIVASEQNHIANNQIINGNYTGIFVFSNSHYNEMIGNLIANNSVGILLTANFDHCTSTPCQTYPQNTNNSIIENQILDNRNGGIVSSWSNSTINANTVCGNLYDFYGAGWEGSAGTGNTCDSPTNWNDDGYNNCTYSCSPGGSLSLPLTTGWNLISAPLNLATWALGDESIVGNPLSVTPANCLSSIYRYNSTSELFEKSDHFDDWGWWPATGSKSFTELEPGRGYWVMAQQDCSLTFTGSEPFDLDIPLDTGWNLIGWYSMNEAPLGEEAVVGNPLNVTPENSLTSIYRYNIDSGLFEKSDHFDDWGWWPATGSKDFTVIEPGRGYWVMARSEALWKHKV